MVLHIYFHNFEEFHIPVCDFFFRSNKIFWLKYLEDLLFLNTWKINVIAMFWRYKIFERTSTNFLLSKFNAVHLPLRYTKELIGLLNCIFSYYMPDTFRNPDLWMHRRSIDRKKSIKVWFLEDLKLYKTILSKPYFKRG